MVFPGKPYGTIGTFTHSTQNFITPIGFTLHIGHLRIGFWGRQRDFLGMLFTAWLCACWQVKCQKLSYVRRYGHTWCFGLATNITLISSITCHKSQYHDL
jgi:hypothetical protein